LNYVCTLELESLALKWSCAPARLEGGNK
jgi:hypothetical protein